MSAPPPNETLYVNNLNDRFKPPALQRALVPLFGRFGNVRDIICMKSLFRRGQAFVIFENVKAAERAKRVLDGHVLFGKEMHVDFANIPSDLTLQAKGLEVTRKKQEKKTASDSQKRLEERMRANKRVEEGGSEEGELAAVASFFMASLPKDSKPKVAIHATEPNRTLFVEGVSNIEAEELKSIFSAFDGFEEVRLVTGRGVAFVDFHEDVQAGKAMQSVHGTKSSTGSIIVVTFAKK